MRRAWVVALLATGACGPLLVDHTPSESLLDASTSSLELGLGHWSAWFSSRLSREAGAAHTGENGMRVEVTAPYGFGVNNDNFPGFPAAPGAHHASFWTRQARGGPFTLEMNVRWRDEQGNDLQSDVLKIDPLTDEWRRVDADLVAPAGTTRVGLELVGAEGEPGEALDVDDIRLR